MKFINIKKYLFFFFLLFLPSFFFAEAYDSGFVKYVYDGDTIKLEDGRIIRYIGVNSPEIKKKDKEGEYYGFDAKAFNEKLVKGKKVVLRFSSKKKDMYDRLLAYVFLEDETFVNLELIKNSCAYFMHGDIDLKYESIFIKAQQKAISSQKGIWSQDFLKKELIIANFHSKRFHKESCLFGQKIRQLNMIFFNNQKDAYFQGYSPAKCCY